MPQVVLASIDTPLREGEFLYIPVAASIKLYAGTLIAINTSTGLATYATDAAGLQVIGRAEYDLDNTADSVGGALSIKVRRGVFKYANSSRSAAAYALVAANIGEICYVENEQTVQVAAGSSHNVVAGVFLGIDTDGNVWVDTRTAMYESAESQAFTPTQNSITDSSTGTAAAPVAGVRTIAAVSSVGTAANAIADIAAELNLIKADIAAIKGLL